MNQPKAYGTFTKRGEHTFRTSAYIQWGDSKKSIGACLLLNPGSANFNKINPDLKEALNTSFKAEGEIIPDPTMKLLIKVMEGIYGTTPLNGRLHIYNLFNLQNTDNIHAIDQFESLVECGVYNITESLVTPIELMSHPWIYLGWGVEQNKHWENYELIKESWRSLISNSKTRTFGKKHNKTDDYYHLSYAIYKPAMINELITLYKQKFCKQRFPTYATKPNLLVDSKPLETWNESNSGWFISPNNPESIVRGFSHLLIKDGYKLRAYQYSDGANGNGVIWAIPVDTDLPDPNECDRLEEYFLSAPKPAFAFDDFMQAIDGDKSPLSYLQASIAYHELHEFGAAWHGTQWGRDIILPLNDYQKSNAHNYEWEMIENEPEIIEPHFYYNNEGIPTIVFHTINDIGTVTMNRYVHTFSKSDYTLHVEQFCIATAGGGIIF
jgi:hypothetical protein